MSFIITTTNDFATRNGRNRNVGHSLDSKLSGRHMQNQAKEVIWVNWWFRSIPNLNSPPIIDLNQLLVLLIGPHYIWVGF